MAGRANREKYGGQHVALRGDELIAHSTNSQEVIALAKAAELSPLFIAWVEPPTDDEEQSESGVLDNAESLIETLEQEFEMLKPVLAKEKLKT
jgi:hypothetical protein